jgi:hypothetical protein
MNQKMIFVLGARRYDFKDEQSGKQVAGVKLHFIDFTSVDPNQDVSGFIPSTETLPFARFGEIDGPGFYNVTLGFDLSGRKPKVVFEKLVLVQKMDFADFVGKMAKSA